MNGKVLQEMCAVLPEDKQGPVLDDIRKISKERRRERRDQSTSLDVQTTGIYRSMSELSLSPNSLNVTDSHDTSSITLPDLRKLTSESSLMSTLRIARHQQSNNATTVYNPAFYDAPVAFAHTDTLANGRVQNPLCQPYLRMTQNNGFSLSTDPMPFNDATRL